MNEEKSMSVKERQTLMQAYERLNEKCKMFKELEYLTERLNAKLNRTEDIPKVSNEIYEKQEVKVLNIVDLFNSISDKLEYSINAIGSITEKSMGMID